MYKPRLFDLQNSVDMISSFKGYENNIVIDENAFSFTENMSSDCYPVLSPRNKRFYFSEINGDKLHDLYTKDMVLYINNGKLYHGGKDLFDLTFPEISKERRFVSMGSKLLIFPDKVYVNTEDFSDCGSLEARFESEVGAVCVMCKADGDLYEGYSVSSVMPKNAVNGDLWYDTSREPHALKQYSESVDMWIDLAETYIRINCKGIGKNFNQYDCVNFVGFRDAGFYGKHIIRDKGDDYLIITGILEKEVIITTPVSVSRRIPDMDFVCESGNRIWGCNSKTNEIYASKLGDPTNFNVFMGLSTDSYAASVGTDGNFTAAISFRGYVLFFKENCVHKIYGQNPPYTITTSYIRGVQKSSHRSLVCLNETLYYKSPTGICAYEGGVPVCISSHLGNEHYSEAVAGACGNKYYVCMSDKERKRHLFVFDEEKNIWHREDNINIKEFTRHNCNLYFIADTGDTNQMGMIDGENPYGIFTGDFTKRYPEDDFEWCAESGLWGLSLPENKYYSNITIRAVGEKGAKLQVYFEVDSNKVWVKQIDKTVDKTGSFTLPFITPRCDHLRIKIKGKGDIKIYSISRKVESGSELNV